MPKEDGTGPRGKGPKTGRGAGTCDTPKTPKGPPRDGRGDGRGRGRGGRGGRGRGR